MQNNFKYPETYDQKKKEKNQSKMNGRTRIRANKKRMIVRFMAYVSYCRQERKWECKSNGIEKIDFNHIW